MVSVASLQKGSLAVKNAQIVQLAMKNGPAHLKRILKRLPETQREGLLIELDKMGCLDTWLSPKKFSTRSQAMRNARDRVVQALREDHPFERYIIVDPKRHKIIKENNGYSCSVSTRGADYVRAKDAIDMHGHPGVSSKDISVTTPISFPDAENLNNSKIKSSYAFNANGEYSVLRKKKGFIPLTAEQMQYYESVHRTSIPFIKEYFNLAKQILPEEFAQCGTYSEMKKILKLKPELADIIFERATSKQKEALMAIFKKGELFNRGVVSMDDIRAIHEFWKKYADEMGFVYKTNYSYLA